MPATPLAPGENPHPGDRVDDHQCEHRVLRAQRVALRQQRHRPIVRDGEPGDVAGDEGADLDVPDRVRGERRDVRREIGRPEEVPAVAEWIGGEAVPRKLTDFGRTPLKTYYLQRDGEPEYHLVNERFDYDKYKL